jgi:hypothetical protein
MSVRTGVYRRGTSASERNREARMQTVEMEFLQGATVLHIKAKLKLSLCFNRALRHEGVLGEWWYSSTHSLISALDGGEWSASRPSRFTPKERDPGAHWIGGWVGPRVVLDAMVKREILSSRQASNPRTPIIQPVAQRYTY